MAEDAMMEPLVDHNYDNLGSNSFLSKLRLKYGNSRMCVSSKAALIILFWSFALGSLSVVLNPDTYIKMNTFNFSLAAFGGVLIFVSFAPLAGYLGDAKYGRYKTVVRSVGIVFLGFMVAMIAGVLIGVCGTLLFSVNLVVAIIFISIFGLLCLVFGIASCVGLVCFTTNVIPLGADQLNDSSKELTVFVHWYVWVYYFSIFIVQLTWILFAQVPYNVQNGFQYHNMLSIFLMGLTILIIIVILTVTLCLTKRKKWFLIDSGGYNPCNIVRRVTKFARPRGCCPGVSACCKNVEVSAPTHMGLDLGKEEHGGIFTDEQVEDVKAFYSILKVLFSAGMFFFLSFAADSVLPMFAWHSAPFYESDDNRTLYRLIYNGTLAKHIFINTGLLSPLLVVLGIPLYLCVLRPCIPDYIPSLGMLKRMGMGMILALLSLTATFSMDIAAHLQHNTTLCMFTYTGPFSTDLPLPSLDSAFLVVQLSLSALSQVLVYTAVFEFICSQSPQSMKGLFVGLVYAIKSIYQFFGALLVVPFAVGLLDSVSPSCGFYFYLINIAIGVAANLVFAYVSKKYKPRRDDSTE